MNVIMPLRDPIDFAIPAFSVFVSLQPHTNFYRPESFVLLTCWVDRVRSCLDGDQIAAASARCPTALTVGHPHDLFRISHHLPY
jgi:hypothetical protein